MPFPMTHLLIAHAIVSTSPQIGNPNDFMLGALAPDAVHYRNNYQSDMKVLSHLCPGDEKWGSVTKNNAWRENVLVFLMENKHLQYRDFLAGYCAHILTDIQNNIKVFMPYVEKRKTINCEKKQVRDTKFGCPMHNDKMSVYHQESTIVDQELFIHSPCKKEIWKMLRNAEAFDVANVVTKQEIEQLQHSILHERYPERERSKTPQTVYVTVDRMQKFIGEEMESIRKDLFG